MGLLTTQFLGFQIAVETREGARQALTSEPGERGLCGAASTGLFLPLPTQLSLTRRQLLTPPQVKLLSGQRLWGRGSGDWGGWEGARILLPHQTLSEGRNSDPLLASKEISGQERRMWTQAREEWSELGRGSPGGEQTEKAWGVTW